MNRYLATYRKPYFDNYYQCEIDYCDNYWADSLDDAKLQHAKDMGYGSLEELYEQEGEDYFETKILIELWQ